MSGTESATGTGRRLVFSLFAALWAIATLFHIGSYGWWDESLLAALSAVWLLARPSSVYRFVAFSTIQLGDFWLHSPDVPNHWLIAASIDLLVLLSYARLVGKHRSFRVDGGELLELVASPARLVVVIVYAGTLVHKLNWDFLSVDVSCAAAFHAAYAEAYPFIPDGPSLRTASIYATLVVEALIPVLLVFARTRGLGVLVGLSFHELLSFNPISGFYNFSAMMIALYLLFAPADLVARVVSASRRSRWPTWFREWKPIGPIRPIVLVVIVEIVILLVTFFFSEMPSRRAFFHLWLPYSASAIVLFLVFGFFRPARADETVFAGGSGTFRASFRPLLVVPVLVFLNGLSPYLGLKTETSFAMYSNLRTEGGRSNHLFLPASLQPFGYQRDLVEIVSSSDRRMQRQAEIDRFMTFFELRRYMSERPDESIRYIRHITSASGDAGRRERNLARAGDDPELAQAPPLVLAKLLYFRDVSRGERQRCMH